MKRLLSLVALLLATGCGFHTVNPAPNEANEPLFHTSNYLAVSAQPRLLSGGEVEETGWRGSLGFRGMMEVHVNRWSSYNFLPVNWNILLTGEQYADSTQLRVGKLHLLARGGISGLAYSSTGGLELPADLHLVGKVLFTPRLFATASTGASTQDVVDQSSVTWSGCAQVGYQVWEPVSIGVAATVLREQLPKGWYLQRDNVLYHDGDVSFYSGLTMQARPAPRHILSLGGGYHRKNPGSSAAGQPNFFGSYRYVF